MAGNNSNERTIYVSNFDQKMTQNLLKEIFIQVGPVDGVTIRDRYAFVEFSDVESVLFACQLMDGIELFGKKMKVIPRDGSKQKEIYLRDGMKRKSDEIHRGNQQSTGHDQFQQRQNRNSASYPNHPVVMPNPVQIVEAYGDRPVPIGEVRFTRSDGWPPSQQQHHAFVAPLPPPFFNQLPPPPPPPAPSPWLTNSAPSSSNISVPPWEVNRARSGHINPMLAAPPPPPPVPPVFYQPRVESVNEKLDKDGGRYRPHHPRSSSNNQRTNNRQQNQDWKQQQERRNHPYKRPNSRNDNYRNGGRSL